MLRARSLLAASSLILLTACARPSAAPGAPPAVWVPIGLASAAPPPAPERDACAVVEALRAAPFDPSAPLPSDPALARWTQAVEEAFDAYLGIESFARSQLPPGAAPCAGALGTVIARSALPASSLLRTRAAWTVARVDRGSPQPSAPREEKAPPAFRQVRQGNRGPSSWDPPRTSAMDWLRFTTEGPERLRETGCEAGVDDVLAPLGSNARLRRAALLHYVPCVEDNFNSVDGPLDTIEPLLRLTAEVAPQKLAGTLELIAMRGVRGWTSKGRAVPIPGDLGRTGNLLHVLRDVAVARPGEVRGLLPLAEMRVRSAPDSSHRARWTGLAAWLETGAKSPSDATLASALRGDAPSRRWALAWIPNQLIEAAPRPYPFVTDAVLAKAIGDAADASTTSDDLVLAMSAIAIAPPLTGLSAMARAAKSGDPDVVTAAVGALLRQVSQVEERPHATIAEQRRALLAVFQPLLPRLREAFHVHLCKHRELMVFARLEDAELDGAAAACLLSPGFEDTSFMQSLAASGCAGNFALGWTKTADAFEALSKKPGYKQASYARRLAGGCRTGQL